MILELLICKKFALLLIGIPKMIYTIDFEKRCQILSILIKREKLINNILAVNKK